MHPFKTVLRIFCIAIIANFLFIPLQAAQAATADFYVTSTADSGAGTLRKAIADADPGDTIAFNLAGSAPWTITLSSSLNINNALTITGISASDLIITRTGSINLFNITADATITSMTLNGGAPQNHDGGAIELYASLLLQSCNVTSNIASNGNGGAIFMDTGAGTLTLDQCNFTNNQATGSGKSGGAIYLNSGNTLSVTNCSFSNNNADYYGGAIRSWGTGTISNTTFSSNYAAKYGGAIYSSASMTLTDCTLSSNTANDNNGGAINHGGATLSMTRCLVSGNTASGYGGGLNMGSDSSSVTLTGCTFADNTITTYGGGGAYIYQGTIQGCTFKNNMASSGSGGGLYVNLQSGSADIINSTFHTNAAGSYGGGMNIYGQTGTTCNISYCTVTWNAADSDDDHTGSGGGIRQTNVTVNVKSTNLANNYKGLSILWDDCSGTFVSKGYNFIGIGTGQTGFTNGVNNDQVGESYPIDPNLGSLGDNGGNTETCAILEGSPALNRGGPATDASASANPVDTDQRGEARKCGPATDIGAYEAGISTPALVPVMKLLLLD